MENKELTLEIPQDDGDDEKNEWRSCCLICDKSAAVYINIYTIILSVIAFCFVQLSINHSCEHQSMYVGILTLILGVLLPQPKMNR